MDSRRMDQVGVHMVMWPCWFRLAGKGPRSRWNLVRWGWGPYGGNWGPWAESLQAEGGGEQDDWCLKSKMKDLSLCILVL